MLLGDLESLVVVSQVNESHQCDRLDYLLALNLEDGIGRPRGDNRRRQRLAQHDRLGAGNMQPDQLWATPHFGSHAG